VTVLHVPSLNLVLTVLHVLSLILVLTVLHGPSWILVLTVLRVLSLFGSGKAVVRLLNFIRKEHEIDFSGNEVYYSNALLLFMKIMLCSKVHGLKVSN